MPATKICPVCNTEYKLQCPSQAERRNCCTRKCSNIWSRQQQEVRLYSYIRIEEFHHVWTAATDTGGYGRAQWDGKLESVPRIILAKKLGRPLAKNEVARHIKECSYKLCCNPDHLEPGTQKQNIEDAVELGAMKHGEDHYRTGLTDEIVRRIKELLMQGYKYKAILAALSLTEEVLTRRTLSYIKTGRTWKHIPWPVNV